MHRTPFGEGMLRAGAPLVACTVVLTAKLGGYGWEAWAWHPALMIAGLAVMQEAVRISREGAIRQKRWAHVLVASAGAGLVVAGYCIAFVIKQGKGHSHVAAGRSMLRQIHSWGGWLVLAVLFLQSATGIVRMCFSAGLPVPTRLRVLKLHNNLGPIMACAMLGLTVLGLYIMLVEKVLATASYSLLFVRLLSLCTAGGAMAWHVAHTVFWRPRGHTDETSSGMEAGRASMDRRAAVAMPIESGGR